MQRNSFQRPDPRMRRNGSLPSPKGGRQKRIRRFLTNLAVIFVSTLISLGVCVFLAGNALVSQRIFPRGTTVNNIDLSGLSYEAGLEKVLQEYGEEIASLDIRLPLNDNIVSLNAEELGIVSCIEQLLDSACYAESQGLPFSESFSAVLSPKKGQAIDASSIFNKASLESALVNALATHAEGNPSLTHDGSSIINLRETAGEDGSKLLITVNVTVLSEKNYDNGQLIPYRDLIETYAAMYQLDPALVTATIFVESSFRESVQSSAGAVGLMQIMPSVGLWIAGNIGLSNYTVEMLLDPEINIQMGCWYLSYLMERYDGNRRLALAAYNAGPSNVGRWLKDNRYSYDGTDLDIIPSDTTRIHGERIENYYEIYKGLYQAD